jgi:glucosylceramidase
MSIGSMAMVGALASSTFVFAAQSTASALPGARVWLTTDSRKSLLKEQHPISWSKAKPRKNHFTITVDDSKRFQQIDGFGASLTDSSAWLIANKLTAAQRDSLMKDLFDPATGLGISLLRQPMGASDFSTIGNYSYDDMPAGQSDPTLSRFSIDHDRAAIIPLLHTALRLNPDLKLIGTPWSPPGWMKTSDSMIGGTLKPDAYQALAQYFVRYVQAYAAEGLPIFAVTPQNEPQYSPPGYPGMLMTASEQAAFVKNDLGPALSATGLSTRLLVYDHNWGDQTNGPAVYPQSLLSDPAAANYAAGIAFHCYSGDPSIMSSVHKAFPNKDIYQTECSGGAWQGNFASSLRSQLLGYILAGMRNWSKSAILWNLALDQNDGPTNGGCSTCRGIVTINQTSGAVSRTADYYALGHFSRFVRPGAYRVDSKSFGQGSVNDVAFQNPDGSNVLVTYNDDVSAHVITVLSNGRSFRYKLPAGAAATFTW